LLDLSRHSGDRCSSSQGSCPHTCPCGTAGDRSLHELLGRCESADDGALALKALRTLRRHRAAQQLHGDYSRFTSNLFLDVRLS